MYAILSLECVCLLLSPLPSIVVKEYIQCITMLLLDKYKHKLPYIVCVWVCVCEKSQKYTHQHNKPKKNWKHERPPHRDCGSILCGK